MIEEALAKNIYSGLYSFIIGSFVVIALIAIASNQNNSNALGALIIAYSTLLGALLILCILLSLLKGSLRIGLFMPFIVMMLVISYVCVLLWHNFDKITANKVSDYYTSFINLTSFLLFIQIYVLTNEITESTLKNFELSRKMVAMLRLFGFLNVISVITLQIILKYYTTDC